MLVSSLAFLLSLAAAAAQDGSICVCVNPSQCVEGRLKDEMAVKEASPDDFHNGEGLLSERFGTCDWEQVCCAVPPHIQIPGQPSAPQPDRSSEEDNSKEDASKEDKSKEDNSKEDNSKEGSSKEDKSKEGDSSEEEGDDDPDLPRVGDLKGCGVRRRPPLGLPIDLRITGLKGPKKTFYGEAPWMVRILGENGFVCGGTLLNPRVVLTAAHCLKRVKGQLIAEVGEWNTASIKEPRPPQRLEASRVVKHPDFNSRNLKNDVALVFFRSPFKLSETVDIICTPESVKDVDGESCMAVGWGKTEQSKLAPYQSILRKVHLPLLDHDACESRLKESRLGPKFKLPSGFVCAGGTVEGDTCAGDGGGPLYCPMKNEPNRMAIVGVTAWGIDCGKGHPAVFASVPYQTSWIYSTISKELEDDR